MMRRGAWVLGLAVLLTVRIATAEIRESGPETVTSPPEDAVADGDSTYWTDIGYGTLCVITNVFYMPVKVVYALLGLPVGGLGYVLTAGNSQVSDEIWGQSLGGDYVVTPSMLAGKEAIHFNGRPN